MNFKIPKPSILIPIVLASFFGIYFLFQNVTLEGPRVALAANTETNYFEDFFRKEPETISLVEASSTVKVPIIIYHSIRPYIPGESALQDRFDVTPELFEQQLVYLRDNGYTPVSIDMLISFTKTGTTTPVKKPVVLTFDDGWENQYTYAFPLLKKYQMVGVFYVYTNPVDKGAVHFLSWNQIKEMSAAGMVIGSHTLTHPYLKELSLDEARKEIFESKKNLETELGKPVLAFAQPFGGTSPEIEALAKEAGYVTARGTVEGVLHSRNDLFNLHGYFVSDNFNDFVNILNQ